MNVLNYRYAASHYEQDLSVHLKLFILPCLMASKDRKSKKHIECD